jgi:hypothetical protein
MTPSTLTEQRLLEKIRNLPSDKMVEVEDFVDFLAQRHLDKTLVRAASKLSEPTLQTVWNNPDDAEYDNLGNFRKQI